MLSSESEQTNLLSPVFQQMNLIGKNLFYGNVSELIPSDAPKPRGNYVTITHYVDSNLIHCMVTGRSVTGILAFLNQTPMDWYAKKQKLL